VYCIVLNGDIGKTWFREQSLLIQWNIAFCFFSAPNLLDEVWAELSKNKCSVTGGNRFSPWLFRAELFYASIQTMDRQNTIGISAGGD
jgi:hypothetical protein